MGGAVSYVRGTPEPSWPRWTGKGRARNLSLDVIAADEQVLEVQLNWSESGRGVNFPKVVALLTFYTPTENSTCAAPPAWSDTKYWSISLRKSTPPQNCQLDILIGHSKQYLDDFVRELTALKLSISIFCEIGLHRKYLAHLSPDTNRWLELNRACQPLPIIERIAW